MNAHAVPVRVGAAGRRGAAGFTLVEVLVALVVMAILATLTWQALDGVLRARDASRDSVDRTVRLSTVLTQWEQDLQSVVDTEVAPPLAFDGQTLRLTRRSAGGVMVVAWAVRNGRWQRWTSPAVVRTGELQQAWLGSQQLQGGEPGQLTLTEGASAWQIYFNRDGLWSNAQSTGNVSVTVAVVPQAAVSTGGAASAASPAGAASAGAAGGNAANPTGAAGAASAPSPVSVVQTRDALPVAVRLFITLDGHTLTRDIVLGPAGS